MDSSSSSSDDSEIESDIPKGSVFNVMKMSHVPAAFKEQQETRSKSLATGNTIIDENIVSKQSPADSRFSSYEIVDTSPDCEGSENVTADHTDSNTADLKSTTGEEDINENKLQAELKDTTETSAADELAESKGHSNYAEKNEHGNKTSLVAEQSIGDNNDRCDTSPGKYQETGEHSDASNDSFVIISEEHLIKDGDTRSTASPETVSDIPDAESKAHVEEDEHMADFQSNVSEISLSNESAEAKLENANQNTVDKSNGIDEDKSFVSEEIHTAYKSNDNDLDCKDNMVTSGVIQEAAKITTEVEENRDTHNESLLSTSEFSEKLCLTSLNNDAIDNMGDSQSTQMFNVKPEPTEEMMAEESILTSSLEKETGQLLGQEDTITNKDNAAAPGVITGADDEEGPRMDTHKELSLLTNEFNKKLNANAFNNDATNVNTMDGSQSMPTFIVKPDPTEEEKVGNQISIDTHGKEADLLGQEGTNVTIDEIITSLTGGRYAEIGGIDIADHDRQFVDSVHDERYRSTDGGIDVVDTENKGTGSGEFVAARGRSDCFIDRQQRDRSPQQSRTTNMTDIMIPMEGARRRDAETKSDTEDNGDDDDEQFGAVAAGYNEGNLTESQNEILNNDGDGLFDIPLDDPEGEKWKKRQKNEEYKRLIKRWNEVDIGSFVYFKYMGLWHAMLVTGAFPGRRMLKGIHYTWPGKGFQKLSSTRTVKEEEIEIDINNGDLYEVIIPKHLRVGPEEAVTRARKLIGEKRFNMFTRRSNHIVRECIMK